MKTLYPWRAAALVFMAALAACTSPAPRNASEAGYVGKTKSAGSFARGERGDSIASVRPQAYSPYEPPAYDAAIARDYSSGGTYVPIRETTAPTAFAGAYIPRLRAIPYSRVGGASRTNGVYAEPDLQTQPGDLPGGRY